MTHKCPSLVERHASCVTTAWASSVRTSCPADLHSYRPLSHSSVAVHRACVTACGSLPDMLHASQTFTKRAAFLPHRMECWRMAVMTARVPWGIASKVRRKKKSRTTEAGDVRPPEALARTRGRLECGGCVLKEMHGRQSGCLRINRSCATEPHAACALRGGALLSLHARQQQPGLCSTCMVDC